MNEQRPTRQEWMTQQERGHAAAIRLMVWIALALGRPIARLFLYPICAYFLTFSRASRQASRKYLTRMFGREPALGEQFRHYFTFASCILDRVYLLNDQLDRFEITIEGEEIAIDLLRENKGCLLFGAHIGSFEILRTLARRQRDVPLSLVMYEDNALKINSVLNAINPKLNMHIIGLGRPTSMIEIAERLRDGGFVALLTDRGLSGEEDASVPFLGAPARFPAGPFRMALLFKTPIILMVALYRGGRRYDIHFERIFDPNSDMQADGSATIKTAMTAYVARLEHYCRSAPYNWFNFYDFWR